MPINVVNKTCTNGMSSMACVMIRFGLASSLLRSVKYCDIPKPKTRTLARRKSSRTVTIISRTQIRLREIEDLPES